MRAVFRGLKRFDEADARINGTIDAARPFLSRVLQPQLNGVDLQLLSQLVDHLLAGESSLRGAGSAVGLGVWLVVDDVVGFDPRVRQVVAAKNAHRAGANDAAGKRTAKGVMPNSDSLSIRLYSNSGSPLNLLPI